MCIRDRFDFVAISVPHSSDVLPSAAPADVSNALFTAVSENVIDFPDALSKSAFTKLVMLAFESSAEADRSIPFCPIAP